MGKTLRNKSAIVAVVTFLLTCLGFLSQQGLAAELPRIIDGSNVTFLYQITVPGEAGFEVRDFGQFVQGRHQLLPALERVVTGMKTGDEVTIYPNTAPDEKLGGRVTLISRSTDPTNRTVEIWANFANGRGLLRPG